MTDKPTNESTKNTGINQEKADDDIDQWLDNLAQGSTKETAPIKKAILNADQQQREQEEVETERDWQRLQFRMRREQIEQQRQKKAAWYDLSNSSSRNYAMAAAFTLVIGAGLIFGPPTGNDGIDEQVMRGAKTEVVRVKDAKVQGEQLLQDLKKAGAKVSLKQLAGKTFIDVAFDRPVNTNIVKVLEAQAIAVPEQGNLKIQFVEH
jgi:hypothetical protein